MMSRTRAHLAVLNALHRGTLVRPDCCTRCAAGDRIEAHHDDYAKPLEVMWLCRPCHRLRHRETATGAYGRPRCLGCGRVIFRHLIENLLAKPVPGGLAHAGCRFRARGRRVAASKVDSNEVFTPVASPTSASSAA